MKYKLEPNNLAGQGKYRATVVDASVLTQAKMIESIVGLSVGLTGSEVVAVLEAQKQVITRHLKEGGAVKTDLFTARPAIRGVFDSEDAVLDKSRHEIRLNVCAGSALKDLLKTVSVQKVRVGEIGPEIHSVTDIKTGSKNAVLSPGKNMRIRGKRLKITGTDPSVGLYLESEKGDVLTVDKTDLSVNTCTELLALIPSLAPGTWKIKLVTQSTNGKKLLASPRSTIFSKPLRV